MKSFQYHFNTKHHDDAHFESFCFTAEKKEHHKLGQIFIVGKISNPLPQSNKFLKTLAEAIKDQYYSSLNKDVNTATKNALAKANELLEEMVKQGNVNWLGNLDFALVAVSGLIFNFVKVGEAKILLSRGDEIYDISENLEYQDADCGPGSVFPNVAIGKLSPHDRLIIANQEIYEFTQDNGIIDEMIAMEEWAEKPFTKLLRQYNKELKESRGIMILIDIGAPGDGFKMPSIAMPKMALPEFSLPKFQLPNNFSNILPMALITLSVAAIIGLGYFGINTLLLKKNQTNAPVSNNQASPAAQQPAQVQSLTPSQPAFYQINDDSVNPSKILISGNYLLLFSPGEKNVHRLNIKNKALDKIVTEDTISFADANPDVAMFLATNGNVLKYDTKAQKLSFVQKIETDSKTSITGFIYYQSKFYLLDAFNGQILRGASGPISDWLKSNTKKPLNAKSIDLDKNLWILTKDNTLDRYAENVYKETIKVNATPALENPTKIWTTYGVEYIYVLEPIQKRLLVVNKTGSVIKQFQNNQWDNLKDFFVSVDKVIYLLNGKDIIELYETL